MQKRKFKPIIIGSEKYWLELLFEGWETLYRIKKALCGASRGHIRAAPTA